MQTITTMETRRMYALEVQVWDASDYQSECADNPKYIEYTLCASEEEALKVAKSLHTELAIVNEAFLYTEEVEEADIESMDDVALAKKIVELDGRGQYVECANYEYKSVENAILVCWCWTPYIGYARDIKEIRRGMYGEDESMTTPIEKSFTPQWSVVATAEEVKGLEGKALADYLEEKLSNDIWRWTLKAQTALQRMIDEL